MVDVWASAFYLFICFLFSCSSIACFIVGFNFGKKSITEVVEETGYVDYKPQQKLKAYVPGKESVEE